MGAVTTRSPTSSSRFAARRGARNGSTRSSCQGRPPTSWSSERPRRRRTPGQHEDAHASPSGGEQHPRRRLPQLGGPRDQEDFVGQGGGVEQPFQQVRRLHPVHHGQRRGRVPFEVLDDGVAGRLRTEHDGSSGGRPSKPVVQPRGLDGVGAHERQGPRQHEGRPWIGPRPQDEDGGGADHDAGQRGPGHDAQAFRIGGVRLALEDQVIPERPEEDEGQEGRRLEVRAEVRPPRCPQHDRCEERRVQQAPVQQDEGDRLHETPLVPRTRGDEGGRLLRGDGAHDAQS